MSKEGKKESMDQKNHLIQSSDQPRILVAGVGGAGCNTVSNMITELKNSTGRDVDGVEFCAMNTDFQALNSSLAKIRINLGVSSTKGLGAGSNPEVGKIAAEESIEEISSLFTGVDMLFIAAGMGGGTGTGAAPVIARVAKEMGILTVGVVTKPFRFEGERRMAIAESGLAEMEKHVDTLIVIPNQNLFRSANKDTTFEGAFKMVDSVLHTGILAIIDLIRVPGIINLDFADIESIMRKMGRAMMGTGEAEGEDRAARAAELAISNPLLENSTIKGARGILVNISGSDDMTLFEVDEAANRIREEVDYDANIIFGSAFNPDLKGKIKVSVVATGIEDNFSNGFKDGKNSISDTNYIHSRRNDDNPLNSGDHHKSSASQIFNDKISLEKNNENRAEFDEKNLHGQNISQKMQNDRKNHHNLAEKPGNINAQILNNFTNSEKITNGEKINYTPSSRNINEKSAISFEFEIDENAKKNQQQHYHNIPHNGANIVQNVGSNPSILHGAGAPLFDHYNSYAQPDHNSNKNHRVETPPHNNNHHYNNENNRRPQQKMGLMERFGRFMSGEKSSKTENDNNDDHDNDLNIPAFMRKKPK